MTLRTLLRIARLALLPVAILAFVLAFGTYFHLRAERIMAAELRQRLVATAALAAQRFDASDVEAVRNSGDADSVEHRRLVAQLRDVRRAVPGIRYAYIVRATDDPNTVMFVADADSFADPAVLDENGNGTVDDDEAPASPGEPYDVTALPEFRRAFAEASVDGEITHDQWGSFISGYAPIRDAAGSTVGVVGLDMNAGDFIAITHGIFSPVSFLLVALAGAALAFFAFANVQRRRIEALRLLEQERTALLDLATHQLGAPLATFRWWLEILRDRKDDACADGEAIDQLQLGVNRMDGIITSLQDASRLRDGAVPYEAEPTDPEPFVRAVVDALQPALALKRQRVVVESPGGLPPMSVDRKVIRGVLQELLENASGYSPDGASITVRLKRERSHIRIDVSDRGVGVPADEQAGLFRKFARATNAYRAKPVGTGLGLYICKGLVERAGGTIRLRSAEGEGTTVSITLPVAA